MSLQARPRPDARLLKAVVGAAVASNVRDTTDAAWHAHDAAVERAQQQPDELFTERRAKVKAREAIEALEAAAELARQRACGAGEPRLRSPEEVAAKKLSRSEKKVKKQAAKKAEVERLLNRGKKDKKPLDRRERAVLREARHALKKERRAARAAAAAAAPPAAP